MIRRKIAFETGDKLYHSRHGLCLIKEITRQNMLGRDDLCYCLEPLKEKCARPRFFVSVDRVQEAGFHTPISKTEAMKILAFLKKGNGTDRTQKEERDAQIRHLAKENTPGALAKVLLILSDVAESHISHEERKILQRAAEGLSQEFSFILKISSQQASSLLRKSFRYSQKNSWVKEVLKRVGRNEEDR